MPAPLVNAPPFLRRGRRTRRHHGGCAAGTGPVTAASLWYFQWKALWLLTVTVVSCCLAEFVCRKERDFDGSAAVTGVLLALSLPSGTPLWAAAVAGFFAIAVVKELFGGIGRNLLNPAMAGRALLMTVWPQTVSGYELPDAGVLRHSPFPNRGGGLVVPAVRQHQRQYGRNLRSADPIGRGLPVPEGDDPSARPTDLPGSLCRRHLGFRRGRALHRQCGGPTFSPAG